MSTKAKARGEPTTAKELEAIRGIVNETSKTVDRNSQAIGTLTDNVSELKELVKINHVAMVGSKEHGVFGIVERMDRAEGDIEELRVTCPNERKMNKQYELFREMEKRRLEEESAKQNNRKTVATVISILFGVVVSAVSIIPSFFKN